MSKEVEILELIYKKPYILRMGANKVSKQFNIPAEDFRKVRNSLKGKKDEVNKYPKILILDIETSPMKAYIWARWKQNIYLEQTISEWFMICWSAKWLGSPEVESQCLTPKEIINEDDYRIVLDLWKLLDIADIVIAHNGSHFDIPKINSRFIIHNLPPTTPYKQIDTKDVAKKHFGFSSNKLDALATYFGIENKDETDFELWAKCLEGDQESLNYMSKYCSKDVLILEQVYLRLRPYIRNHPNIGLYMESSNPVCTTCGSSNIQDINEEVVMSTTKYKLVRCKDCGAISRYRVNNYPKDKKNKLLASI